MILFLDLLYYFTKVDDVIFPENHNQSNFIIFEKSLFVFSMNHRIDEQVLHLAPKKLSQDGAFQNGAEASCFDMCFKSKHLICSKTCLLFQVKQRKLSCSIILLASNDEITDLTNSAIEQNEPQKLLLLNFYDFFKRDCMLYTKQMQAVLLHFFSDFFRVQGSS